MLTSPYSIYVNKRPLRIAFLLDHENAESSRILDAVFAYNRERWGGRYNVIAFTDGNTLTESWWSILEAVDPDIIKSFVTLSDDLLAELERRVSPYFITQPASEERQDPYPRIDLDDDGLSILPTPQNVRRAAWGIRDSILVLLQGDRSTHPILARFLEWNFGGYPSPTQSVTRALEAGRIESFSITDAAALANALSELSSFRPYVYPIQLAALPKEALPPVEHDRFSESFHVVIGDTPADAAYFWNHPTKVQQYTRTYLNEVWLPVEVASNAVLTTA